ncbi:hypothetical protein [Haladaptatus sp. NG-SE-30]
MLTWSKLLLFFGANVVVWLGTALAYVYYFHETDEQLLGTAQQTSSSEDGVDHG